MKKLIFVMILAAIGFFILAAGVIVLILDLPLYYSIEVAQATATTHTLARLERGLGTFRADFGDYPPSDKDHMAAQPFGYQNLAYYLMGPESTGWGGPSCGSMPFGGTNKKIFGPYFERDVKDPKLHPAAPVSDAFRPPRPILYFRAEPTEKPMFDAADNPLDPTGREDFASQEHFEMLARRADGRWVRGDYLLISAGPDRLFGYVVEDEASGGFRPARPEEKEKAFCDDIVNFKY